MVLSPPRVEVVSPTAINKLLLRKGEHLGVPLLSCVLRMAQGEKWVIDDIVSDEDGIATGVSDERGTADEKLGIVQRIEEFLNSEAFVRTLNSATQESALTEFEQNFFLVLAYLSTRRFVVIMGYLNSVAPEATVKLVKRFHDSARRGNVTGHVLFERMSVLARANLAQTVFSREASAEVVQIIKELQAQGPIED